MHGAGEPGIAVPESVLLSPLVQLSNVLPGVVVVTEVKSTDLPLPPKPGMFAPPPALTSMDDVRSAVPVQVLLPSNRWKKTVMLATFSVVARWSVTLPSVNVFRAEDAAPRAAT